MLQGAIIGGLVAFVVIVVQMVRMRGGATKVITASRRGPAEGRAALDAWVPPQAQVPATKLVNHFERFAWLALLGDLEALEREGASLTGGLSVTTQLQAIALAGLLAHRDEARDHEAMERVAERIASEGGVMLKLVRQLAEDLRALARAKAGHPLDPAARKRIHRRAKQSGPALKVVLLRFLTVATERAGEDASALRAEAETANRAF
ncbi:MAG: hypothetical protein KF901_20405 [Myxococcales bacterium]|nr:hypothetical protein [Myxococcales bacterium]